MFERVSTTQRETGITKHPPRYYNERAGRDAEATGNREEAGKQGEYVDERRYGSYSKYVTEDR